MIGKKYDNIKQETIPYPNMVDIVDFVKFSSLAGLPAGHLASYVLTSGDRYCSSAVEYLPPAWDHMVRIRLT